MADEARSRQHGLEQAASIIFALVAVVPLLIFAWTLHDLGAIRSTQAQISLVLAVGISLLGFWMFRSLLTRMAEVVLKLTAALEQASRSRPAPPVAPSPLATPAVAPPEQSGGVVGIGSIRELSEVVRTMDALWYREASAHLNERVQVSVANGREPLIGMLAEATADGLILELPDRSVPISYGRVTAIDRLS
jgi:hypothetical protein